MSVTKPYHMFRSYPDNAADHRVRRRTCLWLMVLIGWISACSPAPESQEVPSPTASKLQVQNDFALPELATAQAQLAVALSRINSPRQQEAALKQVIQQHGRQRPVVAQARLALAYLSLGGDYRLAGPETCRAAIAAYRDIAREFGDLAAVGAKANWYVGWIATDLLGDVDTGMAAYWRVADQFAGIAHLLAPTAPWVTLVQAVMGTGPDNDQRAVHPPLSDIALLEIVRNSPRSDERQAALDRLASSAPAGRVTGYALRSLLGRTQVPESIIQQAVSCLQSASLEDPLWEEVASLLQEHRRPDSAAGKAVSVKP